jgi:hypothetical protein
MLTDQYHDFEIMNLLALTLLVRTAESAITRTALLFPLERQRSWVVSCLKALASRTQSADQEIRLDALRLQFSIFVKHVVNMAAQ